VKSKESIIFRKAKMLEILFRCRIGRKLRCRLEYFEFVENRIVGIKCIFRDLFILKLDFFEKYNICTSFLRGRIEKKYISPRN
jgi:hypothetical protein